MFGHLGSMIPPIFWKLDEIGELGGQSVPKVFGISPSLVGFQIQDLHPARQPKELVRRFASTIPCSSRFTSFTFCRRSYAWENRSPLQTEKNHGVYPQETESMVLSASGNFELGWIFFRGFLTHLLHVLNIYQHWPEVNHPVL